MNQIKIPIKRLNKKTDIPYPTYMTTHASGMDIYADVQETMIIESGERVLVPTGFAIAVPVGFEAQIRPRSGLAAKFGISLLNTPGTIDSDYRGEVKIILINFGKAPFEIKRGDRIAQMVIQSICKVCWEDVKELPDSGRMDGGFGHTGM